MQSEFLLSLENIHFNFSTKRYGTLLHRKFNERHFKNINIFEGLNLKFSGEERVVGIVGRNGAGKSTLCRLIAGIYTPVIGQIKRNGTIRHIDGLNIGMNENLTGLENIKLLSYFMYPQISISERNELVDWAADFSSLKNDLDTQLSTYSNGMRGKVYASIALAKQSDILILDEAVDSLDMEFKERISRRVNGLVSESKLTFLVSHSETDIITRCTHALLIDNSVEPKIRTVEEAMNLYKKLCFID